MDEHEMRQYYQLNASLLGYEGKNISLGNLIIRIEGLKNIISDLSFSRFLDEVAFEFELINSDVIEKKDRLMFKNGII